MSRFSSWLRGLGAASLITLTVLLAAGGTNIARAATSVPCDVTALETAITTANAAAPTAVTLQLASPCTYSIFTPAFVLDGLPEITGNITLMGGTKTTITRATTAADDFRILDVAPNATLSLQNLTIQNGRVSAGFGGGVENGGSFTATNSVFSGNMAALGGGFVNSEGATAILTNTVFTTNSATNSSGGGFINYGTLTGTNVTITKNTAPINGGGVNTQDGGTTTLTGGSITLNRSGSFGGGVSNIGTTTLIRTSVSNNTASDGGGIATGSPNVTLTNSVVAGNHPDNCLPLSPITGCTN